MKTTKKVTLSQMNLSDVFTLNRICYEVRAARVTTMAHHQAAALMAKCQEFAQTEDVEFEIPEEFAKAVYVHAGHNSTTQRIIDEICEALPRNYGGATSA